VVTDVREGGPAAKSGLKQGDVIVSINGKPVKDGEVLVSTVANLPVGEKVAIGYVRDRKSAQTTIVIGDRGETFADLLPASEDQDSSDAHGTQAKLGMSIENVSPQAARQLGLKEATGVLVATVQPSSFAEEIGLEPGDVIVEINHQPVRTVQDVVKVQGSLQTGSDVVFLIERSRSGQPTTLYLAGTLS
jgi:serine protease Do